MFFCWLETVPTGNPERGGVKKDKILFGLKQNLQSAACVNGDLLLGLAALATEALNLLDNVHTLFNLAEDDVLAVEPRGHNGGDEELGSVAAVTTKLAHTQVLVTIFFFLVFLSSSSFFLLLVSSSFCHGLGVRNIRVGAGVGHGQQTRLGVLEVEVLVGKLLAVNGLATSALESDVLGCFGHFYLFPESMQLGLCARN